MYTIIGSPTCAYCTNAMAMLDQKKLPFQYKPMNDLTSSQLTQLEKIAGQPFRTVPQIFIEQNEEMKYIGGYSDLARSFR